MIDGTTRESGWEIVLRLCLRCSFFCAGKRNMYCSFFWGVRCSCWAKFTSSFPSIIYSYGHHLQENFSVYWFLRITASGHCDYKLLSINGLPITKVIFFSKCLYFFYVVRRFMRCGRFVSIYVNGWVAVRSFFLASEMIYYATFLGLSSPLCSTGKKPRRRLEWTGRRGDLFSFAITWWRAHTGKHLSSHNIYWSLYCVHIITHMR